MSLLQLAEQAVQNNLPTTHDPFAPGDTICVHLKIKEGNKERIQRYEGVVIRCRGNSPLNQTFTVRKTIGREAVHRTFARCAPNIAKITRTLQGKVRRARLYYLENKFGRQARIKRKTI